MSKNILYIALGILSFILIGIALYFLFIKKKHYTSKDQYQKDSNVHDTFSGCHLGTVITGGCVGRCVNDQCDLNCKENSDCWVELCVDNVCIDDSCIPEVNCFAPDRCESNVCVHYNYNCDTDPGCSKKDLDKCVNNSCRHSRKQSSTDLGFPITNIYCGGGYMVISASDTQNNLPPNLLQADDIIKIDGEDYFPVLNIAFGNNSYSIITSNTNAYLDPAIRSFSRIRAV